jgi:hypothetical protein
MCGLSILPTRYRIYPRPLRQSGKQGTPPDRVTGASAKAAIHLQYRASPQGLPIFSIGQCYKACPFPQASACLKPRVSCPTIAFGCCCAVLIFDSPQTPSANLKGGVTTLKNRPCSGTLDCAVPSLNGGRPALPVTRHCQVDLGVVPHDRSAHADLSATAARSVRNTHQTARTR